MNSVTHDQPQQKLGREYNCTSFLRSVFLRFLQSGPSYLAIKTPASTKLNRQTFLEHFPERRGRTRVPFIISTFRIFQDSAAADFHSDGRHKGVLLQIKTRAIYFASYKPWQLTLHTELIVVNVVVRTPDVDATGS